MQIPKIYLGLCVLAMCGSAALNAQDNSAQAAARQALEQKMKDLDANPPATVSAAPAGAVALETPLVMVAKKKETKHITAKTEEKKQVRAAEKTKPAKVAVEGKKATTKPTVTVQTTPTSAPVAAPAVLSKQTKLNQLLAQYKADLITPQQYHEQRAALLAEP